MIRVLFVGLGSIGQRHFRNLVDIFHEQECNFSMAAVRGTKQPLPDDIQSNLQQQYVSWRDVSSIYDILFITNPTAFHYETLQHLGSKAERVFIEKPVFHHSSLSLKLLGLELQKIYYVACPLRYTKIIQFLRLYLTGKKVFSVRAMCSSYLPEWRPGQNYLQSYSAHRLEGGGVSIDLIHEWDYLVYLFGFPLHTVACMGKVSDLTVDSDDVAVYIGQYDDKLVNVYLDYFGRKKRRELEIYLEEDVLLANFVTGEIRWLRSGKVKCFSENRNEYQKEELRYFLQLEKNDENSGICHALKVLRIAEGKGVS